MCSVRSRRIDVGKSFLPATAFLIGLALPIQSQFSLLSTKVTLNAADFLVACMFPVVCLFLLKNREVVWNSLPGFFFISLALLTLSFSISFLIGIHQIGYVYSWAALKLVGWFVLVSYLLTGLYYGIDLHNFSSRFMIAGLLLGSALTVLFILIAIGLGLKLPGEQEVRMGGVAGNPNAYGFILLCNLVFSVFYSKLFDHRFNLHFSIFLSVVFYAGILLTGSLAAMGASLVVMVLFILFKVPVFRAILVVVLALGLYLGVKQLNKYGALHTASSFGKLFSLVKNNMPPVKNNMPPVKKNEPLVKSNEFKTEYYKLTIGSRIEAIQEGFSLWRAHPVFGSGLGVHLYSQNTDNQASKKPFVQIHNTAIWILAEMGLFGFISFFGLLFSVFIALAKIIRIPIYPGQQGFYFLASGIIIIIGWGIMSLAHELMYQRIFWISLGLTLAAVINQSEDPTKVGIENDPDDVGVREATSVQAD